MTKKWPTQTCDICGKDQHIAYSVKDELWNRLPPIHRDKILCIECFLEQVEMMHPKLKITLEDFYHLGFIGFYKEFGGTILDSRNYRKDRIIYLGD